MLVVVFFPFFFFVFFFFLFFVSFERKRFGVSNSVNQSLLFSNGQVSGQVSLSFFFFFSFFFLLFLLLQHSC
jgi:hypothetical protein